MQKSHKKISLVCSCITFVQKQIDKIRKMEITKQLLSIMLTICAVIIGFVALFIPPSGIIDTSVLWFTAQLLVFVAAMLGVNVKLPFGGSAENNKK